VATQNKNFKVKNGLDAEGAITATGNVSGNYLLATNSSGDEGGEILLSKPVTNTTIAGTGVTIDVFQNKLRFFEQGGSARGYYVDLTSGGNSASTNLASGASVPLTLTALSTGFSIAGGTTSKTLTVSNTITLAGTDSSTLNIGAGGTLASGAFSAAASSATPSSEGILYGRTNISMYGDTALGYAAGQAQTPGATFDNTFIGQSAGADLQTGSYNVFLGSGAGMTTGMSPIALNSGSNNIFIGNGAGPTSNTVSNQIVIGNPSSNRFRMPGLGIDWTPSTVPSAPQEIIPLDDISNNFDGVNTRFIPNYQGSQVTISNPFRLLLTINGIMQYIDSPDYVWMSGVPRRGFFVDYEGQLQFSEPVPPGSEFDARLMPGDVSTTRTRTYPFKALDILLGG